MAKDSAEKVLLIPVDVVYRVLRHFDTEHEMNVFVASLDADTALKAKLTQAGYYRLSLGIGPAFYCIIMFNTVLSAEDLEAIREYAEKCGGTVVTDERTKDVISKYAIKQHRKRGGAEFVSDSPPQKAN